LDLHGIAESAIGKLRAAVGLDAPENTRGRRIGHRALAAAFLFCAAAPFVYLLAGTPEEIDAQGVGMPFAENAESDLPAEVGGIPDSMREPPDFSKPQRLIYSSCTVEKGETISGIAQRYGLAQDTLLSVNGIKNSRLIQIGQFLKIPNQDGILHAVRKGESVAGIADKYEIDAENIRIANGMSDEEPAVGETIFLPAAKLARVALQEINGDLFKWPVRGYVSSRYGWRTSPFTGARQFHSGLDIAAPFGTPLRAAMAGRVTATGYDVNSGNYVVISHHSGYRTFYGHMSVIRVSVGDYVKDGQRIGDVGSTGLSTGAHCHFTVFKNGVTVNPINLIN